MNLKSLLNWSIVLTAIALATGPVIAAQFRNEIARWYLAAAANALTQPGVEFENYVVKAEEWAADVTKLRDYWLFAGERDLRREPGAIVDTLRKAIAANRNNDSLGLYFSEKLAQNMRFREAVDVLELSVSDSFRKTSAVRNQLSYFRALVAHELDKALEDIDAALEEDPDNDAYRDTRAWVLFQMGRPIEALEDANFAIESAEKSKSTTVFGEISDLMESAVLGEPTPRSEDEILTQREAGPELWAMGALRYHRARILESLQRAELAEKDFEWLRDRKLPTDDRIY